MILRAAYTRPTTAADPLTLSAVIRQLTNFAWPIAGLVRQGGFWFGFSLRVTLARTQ